MYHPDINFRWLLLYHAFPAAPFLVAFNCFRCMNHVISGTVMHDNAVQQMSTPMFEPKCDLVSKIIVRAAWFMLLQQGVLKSEESDERKSC
jgi:hypothetical protein